MEQLSVNYKLYLKIINFLNRISKMEKFKIQICLKISILRMKISTYSYVRIFILSTPNIHDPKISKIRNLDPSIRNEIQIQVFEFCQFIFIDIQNLSKSAILKALIYTDDIYITSYEVKKNIQRRLSPDPRKRYSLVLPLTHKHPPVHASSLPISFTKYLFRTRARGKREGKRIIRQVTGGKVQPSFHRTILQNFSTNYPPRRDHETRNRGSNINFPNFAYDPSLEYSCCSIVSNASVIQFLCLLPSSLPSSSRQFP